MSDSGAEKKALIVGAIINLMMGLGGWVAYYFSNSQVILLDGNFSFIAFFVSLVAIRISIIKATRTETFPFGQYVYEALFSFSKGIMIIGILLMAFTMSVTRVFHFINGSPSEVLNTGVILVYTVVMVILCAILAFNFHYQNKKLNNTSSILRAEYEGAKIDGFMSLAAGLALFGIGYVDIAGHFGFLHYIGDALLVIILVLLLGKGPFVLVRDSFVEIAGGTLQNKEEKESIEKMLEKHLAGGLLNKSYISKTGSNYLIVAYLNTESINSLDYDSIEQVRFEALEELSLTYKHIMLEIVIA
jgi:divalent metal cation (Fe/Co/Zn/Cd) transporter